MKEYKGPTLRDLKQQQKNYLKSNHENQMHKINQTKEHKAEMLHKENQLIKKQLAEELLTSVAIERNTKAIKIKVNQLN